MKMQEQGHKKARSLKARLGRFFRRDDGSATVENVLWLPMLFYVLGLGVDASLLMQTQSNFFVAARDASRQVALGQRTEEEVTAMLQTQFAHVEALTIDVSQANGFVTATISVPFGSIAMFPSPLGNGTLAADVSMWVENDASETTGTGESA